MASTRALSKVYQERLETVLRTCDPTVIPTCRHFYSRQWFAEKIGCAVGTLSSSTKLRSALARWEEQRRPTMMPRTMDVEGPATVAPLRRKKDSIIFPVDVQFAKGSYLVPTLFWRDGIDEWVSDFARSLVVKGKKGSSVEETVKVLRIFRRFQRANHVAFDEIDDEFLLRWLNERQKQGISVRRINYCMFIVHDFLWWAEAQGRLAYRVQTRPMHDYVDIPEKYVFPISSREIEVVSSHGQRTTKWVSGLLINGQRSSHGSRHTPTPIEIERLFAEVKKAPRNGARNLLIMVTALETGARVSEIVQLQVGDFPTPESVGRFIGKNAEPYLEVKVARKNRGRGSLRFNQQLILKLVAYIYGDNERLEIVRKRAPLTDAQSVFLSETGKGLTADSITRIAGNLFLGAEIKKANIHRLRARYITNVIELQLDRLAEEGVTVTRSEAWERQVLVMAVELMGHSHPTSLQPYLAEILQRRMSLDGQLELRSAADRERSIAEVTEQLAALVYHSTQLAQANQLLLMGRRDEMIDVLSTYLKELSDTRAGT